MSLMGLRRTQYEQISSGLPLKADITQYRRHVSKVPKNRLMHRSEQAHHSITSSARASSDGGTVSPSALAVLRLIVSWYFVGC